MRSGSLVFSLPGGATNRARCLVFWNDRLGCGRAGIGSAHHGGVSLLTLCRALALSHWTIRYRLRFLLAGLGNLSSTILFGLLSIAGALLIWTNDQFLLSKSNGITALVLATVGLARVGVALRSRPFKAWAGTFLTGLLLLATAWIAWRHQDGSAAGWLLGVALSASFVSAGISTVWLNWQLRSKG